MIILALAAQLAAPVPVKPETWFQAGDVPVLPTEGLTQVAYGVSVAPDGTALNCFVEQGSGNKTVDRFVCAKILRSAVFRPARDASGQPVHGVYRDAVEWFTGDGEPPTDPKPVNGLDLTVEQLPANVRGSAQVRVAFAADAQGQPASCIAADEKDDGVLSRTACRQILSSYTAVPARNASGVPVSSVQSAVVRFFKGSR